MHALKMDPVKIIAYSNMASYALEETPDTLIDI